MGRQAGRQAVAAAKSRQAGMQTVAAQDNKQRQAGRAVQQHVTTKPCVNYMSCNWLLL
jgi:hypothetical protein